MIGVRLINKNGALLPTMTGKIGRAAMVTFGVKG